MAQTRFAFHRRVNKTETIVGWFSTTPSDGTFINDFSRLIHDYFLSQCNDPIHLVVDTSLTGDSIPMKAFLCESLVVDGRVLASVFNEVQVSAEFSDSEAACLGLLVQAGDRQQQEEGGAWSNTVLDSALPSESELVQDALKSLLLNLDLAQVSG